MTAPPSNHLCKMGSIGEVLEELDNPPDVGWYPGDLEAALSLPVYIIPNTSGKAGAACGDWIALNEALLDHEEDLRSTFLHELAHVLAERLHYPNGGGACHHDYRWKSIARQLDRTAARCHNYSYIKRKSRSRNVVYQCTSCGEELRVAKRLKHDGTKHYHPPCGRQSRLRRLR